MEWLLIGVFGLGLALILTSSRAATAERRHREVTNQLGDLTRKLDAVVAHLEVTVPEPDYSDVVELLREGKRIQAVKLYRERTGVDLKAAADFVNDLARRNGL